jgi:peptidoglycan hydrolase-like protein with peptidoglycan-binding domain
VKDEDKERTIMGAGEITIPEVTIQPYPTIKKGSRGPTVAKWQRMIGIDADGNFGSGTDAATKKWQSDHGLPPDGIVGIMTWAKALENTSPVGMMALEWNQPSPEIPSAPAPATVIPPTPGAVSLASAAAVAQGYAPKTPPKTQASVGAGFFGWLGSLPTWAKAALGVGAVAAIASQASEAGKSGRAK